MTIDPEAEIEVVTEAELAARDAYVLTPQDLRLVRLESTLDILVLAIRNHREGEYRHFRLSRRHFVEWMKNQLRQLDPDRS